jgi:archaeosine synthase beta-subunit
VKAIDTSDLRKRIRGYMRGLRRTAALATVGHEPPPQKIVFSHVRMGFLRGTPVERLVLFLRGSGCIWAETSGGCTFCGFWNATNFGKPLSRENYLFQVTDALSSLAATLDRYPIICLYNDGSLLSEAEIPFETCLELIQRVAELPSVKRIVIEAKITDITESKLSRLAEVIGKPELEIAVGFESANEIVRDLCINKPFADPTFRQAASLIKSHGFRMVPLLLVKPPFLSENQAITDVVQSLEFLEKYHLPRIDLEMATVEPHTISSELWKRGLYEPPSLWALKAIVRRRHELALQTRLFISPSVYTVEAQAAPASCNLCQHLWPSAIEHYNLTLDLNSFNSIDCECQRVWLDKFRESSDHGIVDQIKNLMDVLEFHPPAVTTEDV